jgi:hypothetical protein
MPQEEAGARDGPAKAGLNSGYSRSSRVNAPLAQKSPM